MLGVTQPFENQMDSLGVLLKNINTLFTNSTESTSSPEGRGIPEFQQHQVGIL